MLRSTLLLFLLAAAPAHAATVSYTPPPPDNAATPEGSCSRYAQCPPSQLNVVAAAGERNDISFDASPPAGRVVVRDAGAPLTAAAGCEAIEGGAAVSCPTAGVTSVSGLDGDDRIVAPQASVAGGDGNDVLTGGSVDGGAGDDVIDGTAVPNLLIGGPGADVVRGLGAQDTIVDEPTGFEADTLLDGGEGEDVLSFRERTAPVVVDLDPAAPRAGAQGEANVVVGIEGAIGGSGDDQLAGAPSSRSISVGLPSLQGNAGDDRITLRAVTAGAATGGPGDDVITGGPGDDAINGDAGRDRILAGAGDDDVTAADRTRERVSCGRGRDRVVADRRDRLISCERVTRRR